MPQVHTLKGEIGQSINVNEIKNSKAFSFITDLILYVGTSKGTEVVEQFYELTKELQFYLLLTRFYSVKLYFYLF